MLHEVEAERALRELEINRARPVLLHRPDLGGGAVASEDLARHIEACERRVPVARLLAARLAGHGDVLGRRSERGLEEASHVARARLVGRSARLAFRAHVDRGKPPILESRAHDSAADVVEESLHDRGRQRAELAGDQERDRFGGGKMRIAQRFEARLGRKVGASVGGGDIAQRGTMASRQRFGEALDSLLVGPRAEQSADGSVLILRCEAVGIAPRIDVADGTNDERHEQSRAGHRVRHRVAVQQGTAS